MKVIAINIEIYINNSRFLLAFVLFILATPIPTKYPTTGPKTETSWVTPDRKDPKNIKSTRKDTKSVFLVNKIPSYPKFFK